MNIRCRVCANLPYEIFDTLNTISENEGNAVIISEATQKLRYFCLVAYDFESNLGLCTECEHGIEYAQSRDLAIKFILDENYPHLKQALHYWEVARAHDKIFNAADNTPASDFSEVSILDGQENIASIYLDFNVYGEYEKNSSFKELINILIPMSGIRFVYSPTHIEEICRMNHSEYEETRVKSIEKVTNHVEILCYNDKLQICNENVRACLKRARNCMALNESAENLKLVHSHDRDVFFPQYNDINHKKNINNCHISNIEDYEINRVLGMVTSPYTIEDYRNCRDKLDNYDFLCDGIRSLYKMLDVFGFYCDKMSRTIRSSVYDIEHLCYATKCLHFVTKDSNLYYRAKEIYTTLGVATEVKSIGEFVSWGTKTICSYSST